MAHYIVKDEWYPVLEVKIQDYGACPVKVSEEFMERQSAVFKAFKDFQQELFGLKIVEEQK